MRTEILDYLQSQNLGLFTVTREQPWSENDVPLYLKNLKKVYVSQDSVEIVPLFATLDGLDIPSEVTTVTVYLACDAKQTPPNLDQVIAAVKTAKNITTITGVNRRECSVVSSYNNDLLVTELEFKFTKLT
jgi:hypothetical protein